MKNRSPVIKVLKSALIGACIALLGLIILTTALALPVGGPFILLYYWAGVVFYFIPISLFVGAIFGFSSLFVVNSESKKKQRPYSWNSFSIVGVFLIFVIIFVYIAFPHFTLSQVSYVEHGATWVIASPDDENLPISERYRDDCQTEVILFTLETYHHYDAVCSQDILNYLETIDDGRAQLTYQITSDFGEFRGWHLASVGDINVSGREWIPAYGRCDGVFTLPCDAPNVSRESHLLGSTWSN